MTVLNDLVHILLCREDHEYDMMKFPTRDSSKCYYYLECDISGGETMPDHMKWQMMTNKIKNSLGFSSDEETLEFIKELIRISQSVHNLSDGNPIRLQFIQSILN